VRFIQAFTPMAGVWFSSDVFNRNERVLCASRDREGIGMKVLANRKLEEGKVGWVLLWLLGVPIPVLLILFLLRGCT
jgi:hypothetical protein